ncbi:hypothetical protein [Kitasatospora viridis]|uniref:Phage protein D n=1 Tax=Kitasatospora viridis TaxID=281105 RepID=A0A561UKN7_9ACTN|nr:hypothetical protein [Kitasatospora viridis]TWF99905.1 hypothetical protein FHX73_113765 [Kitasatospora viridis]
MAQTDQLLVCDLRSDQLMDRIPISGLSFDDYIGKTGSLAGTVPIPDAAMAARAQAALLPGRTMLWLQRGMDIVWGGILWTATPTRDERGRWTLPIQAAGVESYFRAHQQLTDTQVSTAVDQLDIARGLIAYCQGRTGGNIGVEIDYTLTSGTLRNATYLSYDLPWVGQLIDQLAAMQGGFEWRINCYRDGTGARHKALQLGYPKITAGSSDVVLTSPGPITALSLPQDATAQANAWTSRGATINANIAGVSYPLVSGPLTTPADYAAGWPRLDGSSDYSTVSVQSDLDQHAAADLARAVRPIIIPTVRVLTGGGALPPLGSTIRLNVLDPVWSPAGWTARYRLVGYKVTPEERGRPESTDLYLEAI